MGGLLVPSYQLQQREEIRGYLTAAFEMVLQCQEEMWEPSAETADIYAYITMGLHIAYIADGDETAFVSAMQRHMNLCLQK